MHRLMLDEVESGEGEAATAPGPAGDLPEDELPNHLAVAVGAPER